MELKKPLSNTILKAVYTVSQNINVPSLWLIQLINFETGGTWNPKLKSRVATSTAKGLLQFNDAAAKDLGYSSSAELIKKFPTVESQLLGPVLARLKKLGPYKSKENFFMANIQPAYRNTHPDVTFLDLHIKKYGAKKGIIKYQKFSKANPGIHTIRDYVRMAESRFG